MTDAEWRLIEPCLPREAGCCRKRAWPMREMVNAIFYVLRGGVALRLLPHCFPPWRTVYGWFIRFRDAGTWETIDHHLVMLDRERVGREASPSAAIIDSQSVKTTESGGVRGDDAGKKIKGRKRHALVDTDGRALELAVHAASVQDRDGAGPLLRASRRSWLFVELVFADAGYQGPRVAAGSPIRVEIVRRGRWTSRFRSDRAPPGGGTLPGMDQPKPQARKEFRTDNRIRRGLPLRRFGYATPAKTGSLKRFQMDSYKNTLSPHLDPSQQKNEGSSFFWRWNCVQAGGTVAVASALDHPERASGGTVQC